MLSSLSPNVSPCFGQRLLCILFKDLKTTSVQTYIHVLRQKEVFYFDESSIKKKNNGPIARIYT